LTRSELRVTKNELEGKLHICKFQKKSIYKCYETFLVAQIFLALWKSPNAQKNWAFWEYLRCSLILGILKRLDFIFLIPKHFWAL
jgi:hypothetical protein